MIIKYFNTTLRCPAHELPVKLREMEYNIQTYRQMYPGYVGEEVFIESSAYMTLIGAAQHISTLPIELRKGEGTCVGNVFGITARSSVFTPVKQRDDENVPSLTIQYRMLG
jgi:hypothetical protein